MINGLTPWIGFEYRDTFGWLDSTEQRGLIEEAITLFKRMFGVFPLSACAPGYRANDDTRRAWAESGICVAQNGPGLPLAPYIDRNGLLTLHRNVNFEPALDTNLYNECYAIEKAENIFSAGKPIIVSMHSINFHSTLSNYRDVTLDRLDRFLTLLEERYHDLLYANDSDILQMAQKGYFEWEGRGRSVKVRKYLQLSPWLSHQLGSGSTQSANMSLKQIILSS
jgi:hypothetical protein